MIQTDNITMKRSFFLIILIAWSIISNAQLISNKYNIYLSYSVGSFSGAETINEVNYITPSLYTNYNELTGFSVKGLINSEEYLSYGINYDYQSAYEWISSNYFDFENSETHLHSITLLIRVHNKFKENGLSNKLLLFFECGPTIGFSNLVLSKSLFEILPYENNSTPPMSDNNFITGLKGILGLEYSFTQNVGFFYGYSYNMNWVSSKLYNDKSFMNSLINIGLVVKLNKNKYFYY